MNIFTSKNRMFNHLYYPIIFTSIIFLIFYLIMLLPFEYSENIDIIMYLLWASIFSSFFSSSVLSNSKKTALITISTLLTNIIFYLFTSKFLGYLINVFVVYFLIKLFQNFDFQKLSALLIVFSTFLGIIFGLINISLEYLTSILANSVSNISFFFGIINEVYSLIFDNSFSNLFYFEDYGVSTVINNSIITGAIDAFMSNTTNPVSFTSFFLTGKYFATIFLPLGTVVGLYNKIKKTYLLPFILSIFISVFFGNNILFSILIFFYNPFLYMGYLFCVGLGYFLSNIIDIRIGFENSASIFEMIKYQNSIVYFLLIAVVFVVMMYFITHYISQKYDIDSLKFIPREARELLSALGGVENIVKINDENLEVKNPNLINILKVDCEIKSNMVVLDSDDLKILSKYIE